MRIFGMPQVKDKCYAAAAALTYWVFKCRDKTNSPAMGLKTWSFLETSISSSAEISSCLEEYLQHLQNRLKSQLRPGELTKIICPQQRILRVSADCSEIQEIESDQSLAFLGWRDLLEDLAKDGFTEWDVLEVCRNKAGIIQVICQLRFKEDRVLGSDALEEDVIEVEATTSV